jgi:hypothetical protein
VRWLSAFAVVVPLVVVGSAPAADEVALERPAGVFDRAARAEDERVLHSWLVGDQVAAGLDVPLVVDLDAADRAALAAPPPRSGRLRVGVAKPLGAVVDFSDLPRGPVAAVDRRRGLGAIRGTGDGGYVWTAVI